MNAKISNVLIGTKKEKTVPM